MVFFIIRLFVIFVLVELELYNIVLFDILCKQKQNRGRAYLIANYWKPLLLLKQKLRLVFDNSKTKALAAVFLRWDPYTS